MNSLFIFSISIFLQLLHISNGRSEYGSYNTISTNYYKQFVMEPEEPLQPQFFCPLKCVCETSVTEMLINVENKIEKNFQTNNYVPFAMSIYCHRGGLNDTDFFNILHQIPHTTVIDVLEIRAPIDRPNNFQWSDNLNRFTKLKKLALINCGIPTLSRSVRMPSLEHLDLSYNRIDEVQIGTFIGLPLLKTLDISHNRIKSLPTGAFMYSRKLEKLSLSHNKLTELAASVFRGPQNLLELELDGNGSHYINAQQLNELFTDVGMSLERLEINGCELNNNEVDMLEFTRIPNLKRLGLARNNLTQVPSVAIRSLPYLQTIDLSYNTIRVLEPCAFCACNISRVFLAHNLLGLNIPTDRPEKLLTIESIHHEAFANTQIVELDLSHNFFNVFSSKWLHVVQSTIETLHLSGNGLNKFNAMLIHTLPRLTQLHLAENKIREIPYSVPKYYAQLKFLNVSDNLLENLPSNMISLFPQLEILDLSHNKFSSISTTLMVTFIEGLSQVYLHNNPWDCECAVQNLQQYMLQRLSYKNQLNFEKTVCDRPKLLRDQPLYRVQKINDCAILFGATYGLNQISELLLLLAALIIAAFLVFVLVILILHCGRESKQKEVYITEPSQMQLTHPLDIVEDINAGSTLNDQMQLPSTFLLNGTEKRKKFNNMNGFLINNKPKNSQTHYKSPPPPETLFVTF